MSKASIHFDDNDKKFLIITGEETTSKTQAVIERAKTAGFKTVMVDFKDIDLEVVTDNRRLLSDHGWCVFVTTRGSLYLSNNLKKAGYIGHVSAEDGLILFGNTDPAIITEFVRDTIASLDHRTWDGEELINILKPYMSETRESHRVKAIDGLFVVLDRSKINSLTDHIEYMRTNRITCMKFEPSDIGVEFVKKEDGVMVVDTSIDTVALIGNKLYMKEFLIGTVVETTEGLYYEGAATTPEEHEAVMSALKKS